MFESIWFDRYKYQEAETKYQESLVAERSPTTAPQATTGSSPLVQQIASARSQIQQTLSGASSGSQSSDLHKRVTILEQENAQLRKVTDDLKAHVERLEARLSKLEQGGSKPAAAAEVKPAPAKPAKKEESDDDDSDDDLFASESEDEEQERIKQERLAAYKAKKAKKPAGIAKSNIILDVKPWDDETDMAQLEKHVRSVAKDGLLWGSSKLVDVAYGVKKLQITCVIEDDKISTDFLDESITAFEDFVQSVDIAAFNKI